MVKRSSGGDAERAAKHGRQMPWAKRIMDAVQQLGK